MDIKLEKSVWDNPSLEHEIVTFCNTDPEYSKAERKYGEMLEKLEGQLGYAAAQEVENCVLDYLARISHIYYLFGLGLRQEVLWALGRE